MEFFSSLLWYFHSHMIHAFHRFIVRTDPVQEYTSSWMLFLVSRRNRLLVPPSQRPWWVHVVFFRELWFRWCLVDILEESSKYVIAITQRFTVIWANAERKTVCCRKLPFLEMIFLRLPCCGHIQFISAIIFFLLPCTNVISISIRSEFIFCVCQGCVVTARGPLQD